MSYFLHQKDLQIISSLYNSLQSVASAVALLYQTLYRLMEVGFYHSIPSVWVNVHF